MSDSAVQKMKSRIWRRIVVKSIILGLWVVGLLAIAFRGGQELTEGTYLYMVFAIVAVWAVSTVRDVRRLRDEAALRKAAIEEADERNVLITYKATRLAVVVMLCLLPVAMCALAYSGRQDIIDVLGFAVCLFLVIYLGSWFYVSRKC